MSHELRNPIGVVQLSVQLLLDEPSLDAAVRGRLDAIARNADKMERLTGDLVDYGLIQAGELTIEPQPCRVSAVVDDAVKLASPVAATKGVELNSGGADDKVLCDQRRAVRALSACIDLAVGASPAGGRIWITVDVTDDAARFAVRHTGARLPDARRAWLLAPSWRPVSGGGAAGFAWFVARAFVSAHAGEMGIDPGGSGDTYWFTLPRSSRSR